MAESELDIRITAGTPHLTLTGELWGVCCEDFGENWLRYNGTALYLESFIVKDKDVFILPWPLLLTRINFNPSMNM